MRPSELILARARCGWVQVNGRRLPSQSRPDHEDAPSRYRAGIRGRFPGDPQA